FCPPHLPFGIVRHAHDDQFFCHGFLAAINSRYHILAKISAHDRATEGCVQSARPRPDVPSVGDFVPGLEASIWQGVGAPKDTPSEIVEKLNKEINSALADPKMKARFADLGSTVFPTSPSELGKFIADETEKWARVIRTANIKVE